MHALISFSELRIAQKEREKAKDVDDRNLDRGRRPSLLLPSLFVAPSTVRAAGVRITEKFGPALSSESSYISSSDSSSSSELVSSLRSLPSLSTQRLEKEKVGLPDLTTPAEDEALDDLSSEAMTVERRKKAKKEGGEGAGR